MAKALPGFIRTGGEGLNQLAGGQFIKLEAGKPVELICLTGVEPPVGEQATGKNSVISFNQYTMWLDNLPDGARSPMFVATGGPFDPGHLLGLETRFKALMLCMVPNEEGEKILSMGASVFKQLVEIEQTSGESLRGHVIRILKTGEGLKTKYRVTPTTKAVNIDGEPETDLMDNVGPTERDEIVKMLVDAGVWPPPGGDPFVKSGKSSKKTPPPAAQSAAPRGPVEPVESDDAPFEVVDDDTLDL